MKKDSNEKTVLYSQNDFLLDDALKTYEQPVEEKRSFNTKKLIVIICACVVFLAIVAASFFFISGIKPYPRSVVKLSDGKYALAGKKTVLLDTEIKEIKTSYKNAVAMFLDNQNNLYALKTEKFKKIGDAQLVAKNFEGDYFIVNQNCVAYLSGNDLFCCDFKKTTQLAKNVTDVFNCENSEKIVFKTSENKLFSGDMNGYTLLAENVEKTDFHCDGNDINLVFSAGGKLYLCSSNATVNLLSESSDEYFCGEQDEVWENVYFYEKSAEKKRLNVEFSDSLASSDSEMKEPVSSDYQKSLVFGLIQYVDPAKYKAAYIEYQKKLDRDKVREYANAFNGSIDCLSVMCFNSSGTQKLCENVLKGYDVSFAENGVPHAMFLDPFAEKTQLEIAEIAENIKLSQIKSQEDFDKYIIDILDENAPSKAVVFSADSSSSFSFDGTSEFDSVEISKNGEAILFEKDGEFSLAKISGNSLEIIFENETIKDHFFENGKLLFTDKADELFCIDFAGSFEKTSVEKNVKEIAKTSDRLFIKTENENGLFDWATYVNGETKTVAKNCSDFLFVNEENYYYVSQGNLYCVYGDKLFVQNSVAQIIK